MDCQLSVILGPFAEEGISAQDVETCGAGYSMGGGGGRRRGDGRWGGVAPSANSQGLLSFFCKRRGWSVKSSLEAPAMRLRWTALTSALMWERTASSSSISQTVKVLRKFCSNAAGGSPRQRSQLFIGSIKRCIFLCWQYLLFPSLWYLTSFISCHRARRLS